MMTRYFSVEEANEVLRTIRPLVGKILDLRDEILERSPEAWPAMEKAAGNGGNAAAGHVEKDFETIQTLIHQIRATGAQFKDVNLGLVDFPGFRNGREIYLCWKYDEDQILYWHELDGGYAGRRLLED